VRVLALDVGAKTIGVAVSDEERLTASGVTTIRRRGLKEDLRELEKIILRYRPSLIVLGVPYLEDGALSPRGNEIVRFGSRVSEAFKIPVVHWDESFTTVQAERVLLEADLSRRRRKEVIDKMAAVVILKEYLESLREAQGE
jgi:putative Holliday junction resolvase